MDPQMQTKITFSLTSSSLIPPGFASSLGEMHGRAHDQGKAQSVDLALERADGSGSGGKSVDVEMFVRAVCSAQPRNRSQMGSESSPPPKENQDQPAGTDSYLCGLMGSRRECSVLSSWNVPERGAITSTGHSVFRVFRRSGHGSVFS